LLVGGERLLWLRLRLNVASAPKWHSWRILPRLEIVAVYKYSQKITYMYYSDYHIY